RKRDGPDQGLPQDFARLGRAPVEQIAPVLDATPDGCLQRWPIDKLNRFLHPLLDSRPQVSPAVFALVQLVEQGVELTAFRDGRREPGALFLDRSQRRL